MTTAAATSEAAASVNPFASLTDSDLRQTLDDAGVQYGDGASRGELIRLLTQYEEQQASGGELQQHAGGAAKNKVSGRGHVFLAQICVG